MATAPTDIDDIRRRMAQIRRELHEDVQGVVAGAEAVADWRRWIRNYPWASVGVAFVLGYVIIPRKHRSSPTIHITHPDAPLPVAAQAVQPPAKKKKSLILKGLGLLAPVVFRAGQGYALQFLEQWMAQRMQAQAQQPFDFASAFGVPGHPAPGQPPRPGNPAEPRRF
ncbi:hypothetical protein TA3x_001374 [Tundrisphaera sp. TA3]|uniref:hypothetical protein n=1 Tax=Tundrisphaera sp. TA3 TaxID=3435775 RepID=UPI003EBB16AB